MQHSPLQLAGMKAILVLIAAIGIVGFRWAAVAETLPPDGRSVLEGWIQLEFQQDDPTSTSLAVAAAELDPTRAVRIESLSANGAVENLVVKVRLAPNAAMPRNTPLTRYYSLGRSSVTGWGEPGRATALDYYLRLF